MTQPLLPLFFIWGLKDFREYTRRMCRMYSQNKCIILFLNKECCNVCFSLLGVDQKQQENNDNNNNNKITGIMSGACFQNQADVQKRAQPSRSHES